LFALAAFAVNDDQWVVEQQPGGTVTIRDDTLVIDDAGGCTVWYKPKLTAPVVIRYEARVLSSGRVSDLNCFWMASDPRREDLLAAGHGRDGKFATYDPLRTYYVGYGANDNTTTRFRRYDGSGARPLLFSRDGEVIFDVRDPAPLREGWFGFRTVHSKIEIRNFSVK
jgi:hypothetical protein